MIKLWTETDEREYAIRHGNNIDNDILQQAYATTLFGADNDLTMHGGGNTSVKKNITDKNGTPKRALYVKASGTPLNEFLPEHFVAMDLDFLENLKSLDKIDDETMAREFKKRQLTQSDKLPSIESLMHAFNPAKFVSHTHPAAILKIVNRTDGTELAKKCFGDDLAVIPYAKMGLDLAKATRAAAGLNPRRKGIIIIHHGLVTWGDDAREVYERTIDIVTSAEEFLSKISANSAVPHKQTPPREKISLAILNTPDVMELINSPNGKKIISDPPLTPDYPMYRRIKTTWVDTDADTMPIPTADTLPHAVIHPPIGVLCYGIDEKSARMTADFVRQAFSIRRAIAETGGTYQRLAEEYLLDMQYRGYQGAGKMEYK